MTPLQIATLGIRLVGLIWAVVAISNSHRWIAYFGAATTDSLNLGPTIFLAALQLATCAFLLMFPATTARLLLPSLRSVKEPAASTPLQWQTLAVISVGLWVLSRAIPDAFYWITFYVTAHRSGLEVFPLDPEHTAGVVATVIEIALGVWLTVGGQGLAEFLFRLRTAGVKQ
jgi:hypothetical protein